MNSKFITSCHDFKGSILTILEILLDSFGMGKKILKEWKGVHVEVKVFLSFLPRRGRTTTNKEKSRKWMREQTHGQRFLCALLGHLKNECLECLRIHKYTSCSYCFIHNGGFDQLWWIDSRPTICSSLQGFQQVRRSYDGIVLTLTLVARLVVQVSGDIIFFMWYFIITLPSNENSQNSLKERT